MSSSSNSDIKKQQSPWSIPMEDIDQKGDSSDLGNFETYQRQQDPNQSRWKTFKDSFKRKDELGIDEIVNDTESQSRSIKDTSKKSIKTRHVALIAIGGGMGTGLLVGNSKSLAFGGPGSLAISYIVVGIMLFFTMLAGGELAVAYQTVTGGYNAYCAKLVDPSLGFATSWNYAINWLIVLPLELVTASMTIKFWNESINSDIFVAVFFVLIIVINFVGAEGYAEAEFWFNLAKVLMLFGFIILGLIIDTGRAGNGGYVGGRNWELMSFANGFKGFCATLINSIFSLGGTEFAILSSASQKNPRKSIPTAMKVIFLRIFVFYLVSIIVVGLLVPYNSDKLMGAGHSSAAPVSPYVIAVESYGIKVVPHIINAVILLAVLSVGNSALFSSARTLYSLSEQGMAPQWFNYVDRRDRPLRAMLVSTTVGCLCFIAAYENQESVFTWLLSLSGLSILFTWTTISMSHVRFRSGMKAQGFSLKELGFVCSTGSWGSYFAIIFNILALAAQFWVSLFPIKGKGASAINFFQNYLGMVIFIIFYFAHKIWTKNWILFIKAEEIDLVKDRTIADIDVMQQEEREEEEQQEQVPFWKKFLKMPF